MEKKKNYSGVFWSILFFVSVLGAIASGKISEIRYTDLLSPYLILLLVLGIMGTIIQNRFPFLMENNKTLLVLGFGYVLSIIIISFSPFLPVDNLWLIGGILVSRMVTPYIGLTFHLIFTYLFCALNNCSLEDFICYLLIGTIMCLLVQYMTKWTTFFYVTVISLSVHVIIILLMQDFILEKTMTMDSLYALGCDGLMLLVVYLLPVFRENRILKEEENQIREANQIGEINQTGEINQIGEVNQLREANQIGEENRIKEENQIEEAFWKGERVIQKEEPEILTANTNANVIPFPVEEKEKERVDYESYLSGDTELIKSLKEFFPSVYRHSLLVSILSEKAAEYIQCNPSLAKAGSMYHEIGKLSVKNISEGKVTQEMISQNDYVQQGILLAKEHNLPEEIIAIIREHNGKNGVPKSKESMIVMFTESIIGTIKYFEKETGKKVTNKEKIIEDIFELRLKKGILDQTGLSLLEYKLLKEFYQNNIP